MRRSGILMHISSLQNNFGIGSMGDEAFGFIDFLADSGQKVWQILPLGHTGYGDSPYQCFSAFAGNPNLISLERLQEEKLLKQSDFIGIDFGQDEESIDYGKIFVEREKLLRKAFKGFKDRDKLIEFKEENKDWIEEYSLYMAVKKHFNLKGWKEWDEGIKKREKEEMKFYKEKLKEDIEYYIFLQYKFFEQWMELKEYANARGIEIMGDLPIYVASDSADMWSNVNMFKKGVVAGCPPDAFSELGQLWGNPIYDWEEMKRDKFKWWINRIKRSFKMYDIVRIDHFRGFESYYEILEEEKSAVNGVWRKGPGIELFKAIREELGEVNIIAEDLGTLTDEVRILLEESGFPGMKVLQFAFGGEDNVYLPYNHEKNSVGYIGTHDNGTTKEWFDTWNKDEVNKACNYFNIKNGDVKGFVKGLWSSKCDLVIGMMQDFLEVGAEGRMNTPAKAEGNWKWRIEKGSLTEELSEEIYLLTKLYGRIRVE
ncbi:MAG: 4-alpha-glucanotransferase [Clostridium sp.]|uniref:4-alpha-glucanotransferase n=1 Tax=Clostridium sp. TaxID=1506 RepID=UPI003F35EB67